MKPRYSIVRVDMRCPFGLEEIFCSKDCHRCRLGYGYYGDTKEQLIQKVYQAIVTTKQKIKEGKYNFVTYKGLAQIIVEFLGVEE